MSNVTKQSVSNLILAKKGLGFRFYLVASIATLLSIVLGLIGNEITNLWLPWIGLMPSWPELFGVHLSTFAALVTKDGRWLWLSLTLAVIFWACCWNLSSKIRLRQKILKGFALLSIVNVILIVAVSWATIPPLFELYAAFETVKSGGRIPGAPVDKYFDLATECQTKPSTERCLSEIAKQLHFETADDIQCASTKRGKNDRINACTRAITSGRLSEKELASTLTIRGQLWDSKNESDNAIADFNEAIGLNPKCIQAFNGRGNAWGSKRNYERAIADYSEAIRLAPTYSGYLWNRGHTLYIMGAYDRAIADLTEVIRLDPSYASAYSYRGLAQFLESRFGAAEADFTESFRLHPTDSYALIMTYLTRSRSRRPDMTTNELQQDTLKIDMHVWPAPTFDLLAGRIDAETFLKKADNPDANISHDHACEAIFFLGEYYVANHKIDQARPFFQKAGRDCPKDTNWSVGAAVELKRISN